MIILIRHGQTVTNAQNLLVGRSDPDLTELGRRQALALRPWLSGVVEVWTSPLRRAQDTASLALPDLVARVVDDFIEVDYGVLDGQPLSVISAEQWRHFESEHHSAFGDGESLASVDERVHGRLEELLGDRESLLHAHHQHLAIVSHMSPIKSAAVWALGVGGATAWRTRLDNGSITVIGTRDDSPSLVRFNVVPILGA